MLSDFKVQKEFSGNLIFVTYVTMLYYIIMRIRLARESYSCNTSHSVRHGTASVEAMQ